MQQFLSRQFVAFVLTGGVAAAVNFGSRILYNQWMDFSSAILLAYLTGMVTAFVLAKVFVFRGSRQALHRSAMFFVLVNGIAVLQTWVVSMLLADYVLPWLGVIHFTRDIAHGIGIIVPVATSYLGHKHWSFR